MKKAIGKYKSYNYCRVCFSAKIFFIVNLGFVPLAGGFLKAEKDFKTEKIYPLEIFFCTNCFLVQTSCVIERDVLFKNYFYFSSKIKTLADHFEKTAKDLKYFADKDKGNFIFEIGCNDGSFLKACRKSGWKILGIDPAQNVVGPLIKKGYPIINDYFSKKISKEIIKQYGKADVIFSSNTLAHIEDMHDVISGIKNLLKTNGVFVFEVHYLKSLIKDLQYDMIYHEHQYYYSLHAIKFLLNKHDLEIFDVQMIPVHAGSICIYAKHKKGKEKIKESVKKLLKKEKELGLTDLNCFKKFSEDIKKTKINLLSLLKKLKKQNKKIAGYGASGRGTIVMNYSGLDKKYLEYVIDDSPYKQGAYTPGNHLKIVSSDLLRKKSRPDYVLVFAWSFIEEIKKRNKEFLKSGGKFIVPLSEVKIVE